MALAGYLSVKQIVASLPVSKSLVYRLIAGGKIPSARMGGKILVQEAALVGYLENPAREPAQAEAEQPPARPAPTREPNGRGKRRSRLPVF